MTSDSTGGDRQQLLEHLVERLEHDPGAFMPRRGSAQYTHRLPDREPGTNLATRVEMPRGVAAILMECGISRLEGDTHVLWVSLSAEAMLGSQAFSRLDVAVAALPEVSGYAWEGMDRLHVRAPGADWDELLARARDAVAALVH
jgi:hypothetical protein